MSDQPSQREQARQQRLSAALRENLKRRKAQAKGQAKGHEKGQAKGHEKGQVATRAGDLPSEGDGEDRDASLRGAGPKPDRD
jgi:hypothetical protein